MDTTPHTSGFSVALYHGGEWDLQLDYPITPRPAYQVTLSHSQAGRVWIGMIGPDGELIPVSAPLSLLLRGRPVRGAGHQPNGGDHR